MVSPEVLHQCVEPSVKSFMETWTRLLRDKKPKPHYLPIYDTDTGEVIGRAWLTSIGELESSSTDGTVEVTITFNYDAFKP